MDTWYLLGGVAMFGASMYIVNRFGLHRQGLFTPLVTRGARKLPTLAAIALGTAGGALVYLGMRAG